MEPATLPPPDPAPSLVERLGKAAQRPATKASGRTIGWALALLLPLGPILTIAGADWLTARVSPPPADDVSTDASRAERHALARLGPTGFAATVDRVARLLPPEARLVSLSLDRERGDSALEMEIATADPDRLRAALSRAGGAARLRAVGERRGDGVLIVSVEGEP
ncbi:hypothetical protein COC42_04965 [Sphingomonas spermidinifaciens]|uniref:Uncharacterized protein n=1 Tax=Sphingomonas spermidinifaciens TaxID=1141889 RepID=A0A2A4B7T2_9SPHN|nr:hypothetical protein [Sphingomonas spermidinifaciens]PCD03706.1 hypothetical protein COC42_04965 [Sphingomonas spermidinifaciens]